jgi:hypothetical protein
MGSSLRIKILLCLILGLLISEMSFAQGQRMKKVVEITFEPDSAAHKIHASNIKREGANAAPAVVPLAFTGVHMDAEVEPLSAKQKEKMQQDAQKAKLERQREEEKRVEEEARELRRQERQMASIEAQKGKPVALEKLLKRFQKQLAQDADYEE